MENKEEGQASQQSQEQEDVTMEEVTPSQFVIDKNGEYCLGIDEAGRGPVLGPMAYACAYCPLSEKDTIKERGFQDSKQLNERQRDMLFTKIVDSVDIGFEVVMLSPEELSQKMLRKVKYNLNTISHDAAKELIELALAKGVPVKEVYVDTVGPPDKYERLLSRMFPDLKITVSKKADSIYPIVSAASICAKVLRDHALQNWQFKEKRIQVGRNFGSGYPGDEVTKTWMAAHVDKVFGFPTLIRFSWKTTQNMLDTEAYKVSWEDDEEHQKKKEAELDKKSRRMLAGIVDPPEPERFTYFSQNSMHIVDNDF